MKKGEAKPSRKSLQELRDSVAKKCQPATVELAQLWKESIEALKRLRPTPANERVTEIIEKLDKGLAEIHLKYSGPTPPPPNTFAAQTVFSNSAMQSASDDPGIREWFNWQRHRVPHKTDIEKMQARDWDASRRVQRTISDLEQLRCGKGPIKPFKGDLEHSGMFNLLSGFGIERLTPDELVVFFDNFCPCGIETHEPDALRKQLARFKRDLQKAIARDVPTKR
jgi:hypothetical protein